MGGNQVKDQKDSLERSPAEERKREPEIQLTLTSNLMQKNKSSRLENREPWARSIDPSV